MAVLLSALCAWTAGHLLYSAACAFSWGKFAMFDYGVYTNMLWNTGHGHPFRVLVNNTYLSTHLSFSLALLGPLFRLWDHPFLLSLVQWGCICTGAVIMLACARRSGLPADLTAALLLFLVGYRFTQAAMLSEFHTVIAYYLLVPWLYYACTFRKAVAWLPLTLILGVREDAFLVVLPLLLYFAVKDRWTTGYILLGVSILYGLVALFCLYPWITGINILARREGSLRSGTGLSLIHEGRLTDGGLSLLWTLAPALLFARWRNPAPLLFPSVAVVTCLLSRHPVQQAMGTHYGAPTMVLLAMGVLEASILTHRRRDGSISRSWIPPLQATVLTVLIVGLHLQAGFLPGGGETHRVYTEPSIQGHVACRAASRVPRNGVLLTDDHLAAFAANRRDILALRNFDPEVDRYDMVLLPVMDVRGPLDGRFWKEIQAGILGVRWCQDGFVLLEKGYRVQDNAVWLESLPRAPILLALTSRHGGEDTVAEDGIALRTWSGKGYKAPITLSYGGSRWLEAGSYEAVFRFRAAMPRHIYRNTWGSLSVHVLNDQGPALAEQDIAHIASPPGEYRDQAVRFEVSSGHDIEVRVTGGDAPLWLYVAEFVPQRPSPP